MARFLVSVFLSFAVLVSSSANSAAQIVSDDGLYRDWAYVNPTNFETILVNSADYGTAAVARTVQRNDPASEVAELFIIKPAQYNRHYFEQCSAFNGKPVNSEWGDFAWYYDCQVDRYLFTVLLYGRDVAALTEVVQGIVEYGSPEPPSGWDDATMLLDDTDSNAAGNNNYRLEFDESWSFVHDQRQSRKVRIFRTDFGTNELANAFMQDNFYQVESAYLSNPTTVEASRIDSRLDSCLAATGGDRYAGSGNPSVLVQCTWNQYVVTFYGTDIPYSHVENWVLGMLNTFDPVPQPGFRVLN